MHEFNGMRPLSYKLVVHWTSRSGNFNVLSASITSYFTSADVTLYTQSLSSSLQKNTSSERPVTQSLHRIHSDLPKNKQKSLYHPSWSKKNSKNWRNSSPIGKQGQILCGLTKNSIQDRTASKKHET